MTALFSILILCVISYIKAFDNYDYKIEWSSHNEIKIEYGDFFRGIHSVILVANDEIIQKSLYYEILLKRLSTDNIPVYNDINSNKGNETMALLESVYSNFGVIISMVEGDMPDFDVIKDDLRNLVRPRIALFIQSLSILKCSLSQSQIFEYSQYLKAAWKTFFVSNIITIVPAACAKPITLIYDPFCQNNGACKNDVTLFEPNNCILCSVPTRRSGFNRYPFKVALFERDPTAFVDRNSTIPEHFLEEARHVHMYLGLDAFSLANLIKHLNFDLVLDDTYERGAYGTGYANGTLTGVLRRIASYELDAGFNGRFIKSYGTDAFEFTDASSHDEFCIIVPKSNIEPIILVVLKAVRVEVFLIIVAIGILIAALISVMRWLDPLKDYANNNARSLHFGTLAAESVLSLLISVPPFVSSTTKERILIGVCLILNIIWVGTIQGTMNTAFSTISFYPDINTLEDFDESGLCIDTSSNATEIFDPDTSEVQSRLVTKVIKQAQSGIVQASKYRDVAALERKNDAVIILKTTYITDEGYHMLHVVAECPRKYFLGYVVSRGSPFLPAINDYLHRITEAGLTNWWQSYIQFYLTIKATPEETSKSRKLISLKIQEIFLPLYTLLVGVTLSCIVFAAEIFVLKRSKKRV